jgi:hypothetical protein
MPEVRMVVLTEESKNSLRNIASIFRATGQQLPEIRDGAYEMANTLEETIDAMWDGGFRMHFEIEET